MKDYTKMMKWAVVSMIDRNTQDDSRSKVNVEALFSSPAQAEENYIIRNPEIKRYILNIENLERFEEFYNFIQDLNSTEKKQFFTLRTGILPRTKKIFSDRF